MLLGFTYRAAQYCVGEEAQQKHLTVLSASPSSTLHRMESQEQRLFLVKGTGHRCLGRCGALIGLEFLLMDLIVLSEKEIACC